MLTQRKLDILKLEAQLRYQERLVKYLQNFYGARLDYGMNEMSAPEGAPIPDQNMPNHGQPDPSQPYTTEPPPLE